MIVVDSEVGTTVDPSRGSRARRLLGPRCLAGVFLLAAGCSGTLVPITLSPGPPTERPAPPTPDVTASPALPTSSAGQSPAGSVEPVTVELTIQTASGATALSYVPTSLEAPAGSTIKLVLSNTTDPAAEVGHNWVLVAPGQEESVLASSAAAGDGGDWLDTTDPGVIAASRLIEGNQHDTVSFAAPPAGAYTFLCTFPDHYAGGMKGTLTIR